ncbi:MAG: TIGR02452 family protein [Pyrinomonadaceae bacterium]
MKKGNRIEIAEETLKIIEKGFYQTAFGEVISIKEEMAAAIASSRLFRPDDFPAEVSLTKAFAETRFEVTDETTIDAIKRVCSENANANPFVLNFASAKNPGGGFLGGAQAQEESLARSSGLYPCLSANFRMYEHNRREKSCLYSDYMIYSPLIPVFRNDDGSFFSKSSLASFITSPAVNAGVVNRQEPENVKLIELTNFQRARKFLWIANQHQHKTLILGAWGCGVFQNDPQMIAKVFAELLRNDFNGCFERVVFAVYDNSSSKRAFNAFVKTF